MAVLFSAILLIPRLRRLRRNVRAWTAVRIVLLAGGALLLWRAFAQNGESTVFLACGIVLVLLGTVVRARPLRKPIDAVARELDALVVLNGGFLLDSPDPERVGSHAPRISIFVCATVLRVLDASYRELLEIPVAMIRKIAVREDSAIPPGAWRLDIVGESGSWSFRYEGAFAEHLARVAEQTLHEVWKKGLPVIAP